MTDYSKDPVISGFQHLGHWLHIAVADTVGLAITTIHRGVVVSKDLEQQFPTLGTETATVAADVLQLKSLAAAVALCVAGEGVNLAADAGVLAALVTDGPALVKMFNDSAALVKTAGEDIKIDAQAIS